jgi:hypothetical protein
MDGRKRTIWATMTDKHVWRSSVDLPPMFGLQTHTHTQRAGRDRTLVQHAAAANTCAATHPVRSTHMGATSPGVEGTPTLKSFGMKSPVGVAMHGCRALTSSSTGSSLSTNTGLQKGTHESRQCAPLSRRRWRNHAIEKDECRTAVRRRRRAKVRARGELSARYHEESAEPRQQEGRQRSVHRQPQHRASTHRHMAPRWSPSALHSASDMRASSDASVDAIADRVS